ncbi:MAG: AgmX/PglI C-terminal domain-containing protein [Byssovorax sp.]
MKQPAILIFAAAAAVAAIGCGAAPPPATDGGPKPVEAAAGPRGHHGIAAESEIGGLDESKVKQVFQRSAAKLSACYDKGAERLPYLAGDVSFRLRITRDGGVRWAHVKDSSLGDRATEECMLAILKSAAWPRPEGGEGLAENSFTFEPGSDERPPVAWSPEQLGKPFHKARGALAKCRSGAGTGPIKATLYVDTDGRASSVGVATADERGDAAASCVIDTLKALTFPSPGSYASKVSVTID